MIPEYEAPGYLWNVVRDLTVALRAGRLDEAKSRVEGRYSTDRRRVRRTSDEGTNSWVRSVAQLLGSGQIDVAMDLLEGELRNSFLVAPMPEPDTQGESRRD